MGSSMSTCTTWYRKLCVKLWPCMREQVQWLLDDITIFIILSVSHRFAVASTAPTASAAVTNLPLMWIRLSSFYTDFSKDAQLSYIYHRHEEPLSCLPGSWDNKYPHVHTHARARTHTHIHSHIYTRTRNIHTYAHMHTSTHTYKRLYLEKCSSTAR